MQPQEARVMFNIDGEVEPVVKLQMVGACSSYVMGIHTLPEMAGRHLNFRTTVRWPWTGSTTLIMRSAPTFWDANTTLIPPVDRIR